jgi:arylsulfatase A-like enzyme
MTLMLALQIGAVLARNVLTIVYDDLRPDLSMYNTSWMSTPHLQKLADTGVVFDRASRACAVRAE